MRLTRVAGGIVWRETAIGPRMALVHRPRRGDWSLPKGRLDAGERWQDAARREIAEETGCDVRLGRFAGAKLHVDRPEPKLVLYWHAHVVRVGVPEGREVDEVAWLSRREALSRLDHASDRQLLLRALGEARGPAEAPSVDGTGSVRLSPALLRQLVVVDSEEADDLLAPVVGIISRVVAGGGRRIQAEQA